MKVLKNSTLVRCPENQWMVTKKQILIDRNFFVHFLKRKIARLKKMIVAANFDAWLRGGCKDKASAILKNFFSFLNKRKKRISCPWDFETTFGWKIFVRGWHFDFKATMVGMNRWKNLTIYIFLSLLCIFLYHLFINICRKLDFYQRYKIGLLSEFLMFWWKIFISETRTHSFAFNPKLEFQTFDGIT